MAAPCRRRAGRGPSSRASRRRSSSAPPASPAVEGGRGGARRFALVRVSRRGGVEGPGRERHAVDRLAKDEVDPGPTGEEGGGEEGRDQAGEVREPGGDRAGAVGPGPPCREAQALDR